MHVRDYRPLLKTAIEEARQAGLDAEARQLEESCDTAWTTSSEMLQGQGIAIQRFLASTRGRLPSVTRRKFKACLNETELACPGWRGLIALLKRPRQLL